MLRIIEAGNTTVQDLGRYGNYHYGIPPSGTADKYSFTAGNLLLNNPADSAGLEITFFGPKILFEKETVISITGAPMTPYKNNRPIPMWENIKVHEGDILHFSTSDQGVRTYLCISGGIQVPKVLGSRSTYLNSKLGGFHGRELRAGDRLPIDEPLPGVFKRVGQSVRSSYLPNFDKTKELRVVMGLSGELISDEGIKSFLNSEWEVSNESNRVAYRFTGSSIEFHTSKAPFGAGDSSFNVVDIPYPTGAVMVPNEEEVIVLLHDGTRGGGFTTIGTVISPDLDLIGQSRPGDSSRFLAVSVKQASEARRLHHKKFNELAATLK